MWKRGRRAEEEQAGTSPEGDGSDDVLLCVRCQHELTYVAEQDFHEGTRAWGFLLGDLGELFTGGTRLELWACPSCGHVEFFVPGIG